MTQMKHKSIDAKRNRRQRYKDACKPIMARFGCTSMQVAGHVNEVLRENASLKAKLEREEEITSSLKQKIKELETK